MPTIPNIICAAVLSNLIVWVLVLPRRKQHSRRISGIKEQTQ